MIFMAREYNISLYAGETRDISTIVSDSSGDLVNLTGYTAELMVKYDRNTSDDEAVIFKDGTINTPEAGLIEFNLSDSDTSVPARKYYYDIKIIGAKVKIVNYGVFEIKQPVNRAD